MSESLGDLGNTLGHNLYGKFFALILTDKRVEFQTHKLFEFNIKISEFRTNIFYYDPMQSSQKAHFENNYNYVRDIINYLQDLPG